MRKIILTTLVSSLCSFSNVYAQNTFWSYDENNQESYIPAQCDGQFDETHGGVFMPTPDELFDQGELFLLEKGEARNNAAYCLLSAAIQGHVKAQYRVAQLYNKGLVLPQNDIVAYRWAFLAALKGSKEAEQLALTLEQILTADEIKMATSTVESMLPKLKEEKNASLEEQEAILAEKKQELEELNQEIDELLGVKYNAPEIKVMTPKTDTETVDDVISSSQPKRARRGKKVSSGKSILTEEDRMN